MHNWYLPITIVPGIGLLILSTSNLMLTLSNEIHGLMMSTTVKTSIVDRKLLQLKTLNRTMIFFYLSIACLAVSGLIGGLELHAKIASYTSILGILFMLTGICFLIGYSYKAVSIRQDQFKKSDNT
ncbi:hypothetical protein [Tenacibaculum amylolyticum]|uniref:hypothetical protein n=1 Tax=Tenacibaculum amylolyticum TaxID=104269 RepID=UPI003895DFD3